MHFKRMGLYLVLAMLIGVLVAPVDALAANAVDSPVVTGDNLVLVVLSGLVPLAGYLLNHFAPWATEPVKGLVQAVLAAGVGAAYQLVGSGDFGWNKQTATACIYAMLVALIAHFGYKVAGINVALGGGSNHVPGVPNSSDSYSSASAAGSVTNPVV